MTKYNLIHFIGVILIIVLQITGQITFGISVFAQILFVFLAFIGNDIIHKK